MNLLGRMPILPRGSDDDTKKARANLKTSIDELTKTINEYGTKETILNSLITIKEYSSIIVAVIKDYLDAFHTYKEQNGIYDFQDIALLSIRVLRENESVRNELRDTFKEIMIDEYQDTNDIQETFIGMIENNNVYCVGDIKQSI